MAKHLREIFAPKPKDEKQFAKLPVKKLAQSEPTKDDKLFKATNVKTFDRAGKRYGNDQAASEKAYDSGRAPGPNDQKPTKGALPPTTTYEEELVEDEGQLFEDTKISKQGHETLKAFAEKRSHESKKLSTDGKSLHGNWMGGKNIAHWDGDKVRMGNLDSRSKQTVQRVLRKKHLAKNDIHEAEAPKQKTCDKDSGGSGTHKYNADSVQKAINNNRTGKIGKKESGMIHRLLKGRH